MSKTSSAQQLSQLNNSIHNNFKLQVTGYKLKFQMYSGHNPQFVTCNL